MKLISLFSIAIVFVGSIISCGNNNSSPKENTINSVETFDLAALKKIIVEKTNMFTKAHITKDTAFLNNIFTNDANAYPPNSNVVNGRTAIAKVNSEWVSFGIKEFSENSTSFYGDENFLIDEGTYYLRFGNDNVIDKGKYINIWKMENGEWKISSNIWNTSLPISVSK